MHPRDLGEIKCWNLRGTRTGNIQILFLLGNRNHIASYSLGVFFKKRTSFLKDQRKEWWIFFYSISKHATFFFFFFGGGGGGGGGGGVGGGGNKDRVLKENKNKLV